MAGSVHLFGAFDEEDCTYCGDDLVARSYKDNDAVVYGDCSTPVVQL